MSVLEVVRDNIVVQELTEYSEWAAKGIGELMPHLDPSFSSEPTARDLLGDITSSPSHAQLIAISRELALARDPDEQRSGRIIGATTLSMVMGAGFGRRGEMEDVIVDPAARGRGIGGMLLEATDRWCESKGLSFLMFVTEAHRPGAIRMYEKWGAERVTDGTNNVEGILYRKDYPQVA